jgi:hypothetical protein
MLLTQRFRVDAEDLRYAVRHCTDAEFKDLLLRLVITRAIANDEGRLGGNASDISLLKGRLNTVAVEISASLPGEPHVSVDLAGDIRIQKE